MPNYNGNMSNDATETNNATVTTEANNATKQPKQIKQL